MSHTAPSFHHGFNTRESTYFVWALVLSLALHALALAALHPFSLDSEKLATILDVELTPKPPAPPPEPPKLIPKRLPLQPVKVAPTPAPITPRELTPEPPPRAESIPVISAPQKAAEPPAFTAPPPELPKPVAQDVDAHGNYANLLGREFARYKQYPRLAQMRGWQGTVTVQLQIDGGGVVISSSISQSSGYEALDRQALEMVKKASPLPPPPEALRAHEFTVHVPVVFRLE